MSETNSHFSGDSLAKRSSAEMTATFIWYQSWYELSQSETSLLMEPHLTRGTNRQLTYFSRVFVTFSRQNLHLNFNNKQVHTFKVDFWRQIHAQLFSPHHPQYRHLENKWGRWIRMQPFAHHQCQIGAECFLCRGNTSQCLVQTNVRYRERNRDEQSQTTASGDAEGLQAERGKHVTQVVWIWWIFSAVLKLGRSQSTRTESAVLIPTRKSLEKNLDSYSKEYVSQICISVFSVRHWKRIKRWIRERPWSARQSRSSSRYNQGPSQGQLYRKPTKYLKAEEAINCSWKKMEGWMRIHEITTGAASSRAESLNLCRVTDTIWSKLTGHTHHLAGLLLISSH